MTNNVFQIKPRTRSVPLINVGCHALGCQYCSYQNVLEQSLEGQKRYVQRPSSEPRCNLTHWNKPTH
jgi:hypothetical protein